MTTLLTRDQVDTLRSIGDGALVLMALWIIDLNYPGRASKASEIAMYIRKDTRTVEKQLNELCASNRVVNTSAGYVLLDGGRALVLEMNPKALALSPENDQALVTEAQALEIPVIISESDTRTMCALKKEEEESINLINIDSPSSSESKSGEPAQNVRFKRLTTENILDESDVLFKNQRIVRAGLDLEFISPAYALGALAHVCAESSHLRNPAGLAYNFLKSESHHSAGFRPIHPRKVYLSTPWQYLPKEFAEKFGMAVINCPFGAECGGIAFSTRADYEEHMRTSHQFTEADEEESDHASIKLDGDPQGMAVWQNVMDALKAEMPKASFETWVQSAQGASLADGKLTVIANNSYARDWLSSRMAATIERLAGMPVEFAA